MPQIPDTLAAKVAQAKVIQLLGEIENNRDRTVQQATNGVTATINGVVNAIKLIDDAPAGSVSAEERAYIVGILDDLSARVDELSTQLKAAITNAKPA